MDPRITDILRHAFFILLLGVVAVFGFKQYKRFEARKQVVAELQAATSHASFYRQFDRAEAESTLLRCVALMEQAKSLGMSTGDLFDRVFERKRPGEYDFNNSSDHTVEENLVRHCLLNSSEAARRLDMLESSSLRDLREGRMPHPPGGTPVIEPLIDPAIAPGFEKIVPNLEIRPSDSRAGDRPPTAIEISAARRLAQDLADADVIEDTVATRILEHYQTPSDEKPATKP